MNQLSIFAVACCLAVASFAVWPLQETPVTQNEVSITVQDKDPDAVSRRDFMRTKLMFSQNILEGLTTGDLGAVETAVKEVQRITEAEQWVEIDSDEYRRLTGEFNSTTSQLMAAVKTGNIDATALRFYNMSTSCIDCHKHIRKAGYRF